MIEKVKGMQETKIILFVNDEPRTIDQLRSLLGLEGISKEEISNLKEKLEKKNYNQNFNTKKKLIEIKKKINKDKKQRIILAVNRLCKLKTPLPGGKSEPNKKRFLAKVEDKQTAPGVEISYELNYKGIFEYISLNFFKCSFDEINDSKLVKIARTKDKNLAEHLKSHIENLGLVFHEFLLTAHHNNQKNINFTLDELFEAFILMLGRINDYDTINMFNNKTSKTLTKNLPSTFCKECTNYYLKKASNIIFQNSIGDQSDFKYLGLNNNWWK